MPMTYEHVAIAPSAVPHAAQPIFQHLLDTYASEINKLISVWRCFDSSEMAYRPHARSRTVQEVMHHELLSQRRFFGEFLGVPEPAAADTLPTEHTPEGYAEQAARFAVSRLSFLARQTEAWWLEPVSFFDVVRPRIWVFWRRVLHTCHHRTQLTVYLRMLDKKVPATYGPTADVTWAGADPTQTVEAAGRK